MNNVEEKRGVDIIFQKKNKKKVAFMIEDQHPAIGRILIVDGQKFRLADNNEGPDTGTLIRPFNDDDEEAIEEYDEALELLSEKLVNKVDIKRLIKENIKNQSIQSLKTGLFILQQEEKGAKIEEEHHRGCYEFKMFYKNQRFSFFSGSDVYER